MPWLTMSDTLTGVVIGSAFTIAGVLITNIVTAFNTGRQLKHDREEKARERQLALRREIYLGAAEALQDSVDSIMRFADLNLDHKDVVEGYTRSKHYLAKLHLVAGPDLVDAVTAAAQRAHQGRTRIRLMRKPLLELMGRLRMHRTQMEGHQAYVRQATDHIRALGLEGPIPQERSNSILRAMKAAGELSLQEAAKHDQLAGQLREGVFSMVQAAFEEEQSVAPMLVPAVEAARKELGEEIDMTVYVRVLERSKPEDNETLAKLLGVPPATQPADA
jgi:hypothetical protein